MIEKAEYDDDIQDTNIYIQTLLHFFIVSHKDIHSQRISHRDFYIVFDLHGLLRSIICLI